MNLGRKIKMNLEDLICIRETEVIKEILTNDLERNHQMEKMRLLITLGKEEEAINEFNKLREDKGPYIDSMFNPHLFK